MLDPMLVYVVHAFGELHVLAHEFPRKLGGDATSHFVIETPPLQNGLSSICALTCKGMHLFVS